MPTRTDIETQMRISAAKAQFARQRGDELASTTHWGEAAALAEQLGDVRTQAIFVFEVGVSYSNLGQPQEAIKHHEQALALERKAEPPDPSRIASCLFSLALDHQQAEQYDRARNCAEEAYAQGKNAPKLLPRSCSSWPTSPSAAAISTVPFGSFNKPRRQWKSLDIPARPGRRSTTPPV